jgi:hypothetical protein
LRNVRLTLSVAIVAAGSIWLVNGALFAQEWDRCILAGEPGIGPCDPGQGYIYQGTCYSDDGCYTELEPCCELPT